jgi:hypothetical protein
MNHPEVLDRHPSQSETSARKYSSAFILVTGAHRSGTTWVGKMLCAGGQAAYISEPLNILHRPGVMRLPTHYWYTYIQGENESEYLPGLLETLSYRYHLGLEIRSLRSGKDILRMLRDSSTFLQGKIRGQIPLIKDPFAVFSVPWFINRLAPQVRRKDSSARKNTSAREYSPATCQVVITIRHPLAFASSLKRLDWPFDFSDLLSQSLLMHDHLEPYRERMETVNKSHNTIEGAALLWEIIYSVVQEYEKDPQVILVRHEDLSLDPAAGFYSLYQKLGLSFTSKAEQRILTASSSENPVELSRKSAHSVRLDSRANLENWKKRLAPEELYTIRSSTEDLANHFYPDFPWD